MADETAPEEEVEGAEPDTEATEKPKVGWKVRIQRFRQAASKHWFVGMITLALLGHGAGLWIFAIQRTARPDQTSEVDLGQFEFRNTAARRGEMNRATFSLHIRFIDEVASRARQQLADRQFRVEQDIEEILRQAHDADFADPHLRELKRQLQEQINRSLDLRSVAEVIVTDLDIGSAHGATGASSPDAEHPSDAQAANEIDWIDTQTASSAESPSGAL